MRDPIRAANVHLADSLSALELPIVLEARRIVDIGAGAGFPGLALAAASPRATVLLVDSVAKKCDFMGRAAARAGICNVEVAHARAEILGVDPPSADLVTTRAVGQLAVVEEYAAPLLVVGGHLVAWAGRRNPEEETEAARAADDLGLELVEVRRVSPFRAARHRHLHVYRKSAATSDRFPRRPGIARKRARNSPRARKDGTTFRTP